MGDIVIGHSRAEGVEAGIQGVYYTKCPYSIHKDLASRASWLNGWQFGRKIRKNPPKVNRKTGKPTVFSVIVSLLEQHGPLDTIQLCKLSGFSQSGIRGCVHANSKSFVDLGQEAANKPKTVWLRKEQE